ncbi:MAG: hypothetical protein AB1489_01630 [Acidobacteriota bacterium]
MRPIRKLIILAGLSELLYVSLYIFPVAPALLYGKYIATASGCFVLYILALILIKRSTNINTNQLTAVIFLAGLLFRLTLIALPPFTSDDIYRYIWDGRVLAAAINPYRYAPTASELIPLRDNEIYPFINHPYLPTIYPPLAQIGFLIAYFIGNGSLIGFKLLALIAELVTGGLLVRLLIRTGRPITDAIIYLWCPLPILEFFISGHVDVLGIPFLVLFLHCMVDERPYRAALALAGAVLVKWLPLIFLPLVARQLGVKKTCYFGLIFALAIITVYLPFLTVGLSVLKSFGTYLQYWSFNSSLFAIVWMLTDDYQRAHYLCYIAIMIWTATIALLSRNFIITTFWTLAGVYLFFPTIYPWYLSWLLPLLVMVPSRAFLLLLALSQISYWVLVDFHQYGQWYDSPLIRTLEYLPFFLLLSYELIIKSRRVAVQEAI